MRIEILVRGIYLNEFLLNFVYAFLPLVGALMCRERRVCEADSQTGSVIFNL